jgi:hypothetical protein
MAVLSIAILLQEKETPAAGFGSAGNSVPRDTDACHLVQIEDQRG